PRYELPVIAAQVTSNRHDIMLQTAPRTGAVNYALKLPGALAGVRDVIEVQTDLSGVEPEWKAARGTESWSGWLPHLDLTAARGLPVGSREYETFFARLKQRGTLTLRTKLDLWQMLRAATQPDSTLDFTYPD